MNEDKRIPELASYEEMSGFWDSYSLADYWEQTEPAEFEVSSCIQRRYLDAGYWLLDAGCQILR